MNRNEWQKLIGNREGSIEHRNVTDDVVSTHTMINGTSLKIESFIHYTMNYEISDSASSKLCNSRNPEAPTTYKVIGPERLNSQSHLNRTSSREKSILREARKGAFK